MEDILKKIEVDKELLSVMPTNNEKNKEKYLEKLQELKKEYSENKEEALKKILNKYNKIKNVKINSQIKVLEKQLDEINEILYLFDENKTSYEKMQLDCVLHNLMRYYKQNFDEINKQIRRALEIFKCAGLELSKEDFKYSTYVYQYMEAFFSELKNKEKKFEIVKDKFEEIYWKCPEIITEIVLNFRWVYFKNEKNMDKYFESKKVNELERLKTDLKEIKKISKKIRREYIETKEKDKYLLTQKFLTGELSTKDFYLNKVKSNIEKIVNEDLIQTFDIENGNEDFIENVGKFLNTLYEYKNYLEFSYIIEDIKKKYNEKEENKKLYVKTKKEIIKIEKKNIKLNKVINGKTFFKKKNVKKERALFVENVLKLRELYSKLDEGKIFEKINSSLNQTSTIKNGFDLANSFKIYLIKCIINNNKNLLDNEVEKVVESFENFLKNPHNLIIKNIGLFENKDLVLIIKDRYKILGFNITNEDLTIDGIDNLISILENIKTYFNLKKANIKIDEIEYILDVNKILNKK